MNSKVIALLLAAGESTRMGSPKQLILFDREALIMKVLRMLLALPLEKIIVVLGHQADAIRKAITLDDDRVVYCVNDRYRDGMSSSIKKGMECISMDIEGILTALVDYPLIQKETIAHLLTAWEESGKGIAIPRFGERRGHPVIFSQRYFQELRELEGAPGARAVVHRHRDDLLEVPVEDEGVILDLDTPDDLARLRARYEKGRKEMTRPRILIRGGGEMASGVAQRLFVCGFRPLVLELAEPRMVRRRVCFGEAVYSGEWTVEGVTARKVEAIPEGEGNFIPVLVDAEGLAVKDYRPHILIDGRMLKTASELSCRDAPLVIGLGPAIEAGTNAHCVIETKRGHAIGKVYRQGYALPYTGIPGEIMGMGAERVLRAPCGGILESCASLGAKVTEGQEVARLGTITLRAPFSGVLRGLLKEGLTVSKGEKLGDIDPRQDTDVDTISDKARAIGGGVLEAIFSTFTWHMEVGNP